MSRQQVLQVGIAVVLVILFLVGCGGNAPTAVSEAPAATSEPEQAAATPTPEPPAATSTPEPPTPTPEPPTDTPTPEPPTATPEPPAATPVPIPEIKTKVGNLLVEEVELSDRFPPGCSNPPSEGCDQAAEGRQLLVVWLKSADGSNSETIVDGFFEEAAKVYVIGDDNSQTDQFMISFRDGRFVVVFAPLASVQNFKLFWPDNEPIELGK